MEHHLPTGCFYLAVDKHEDPRGRLSVLSNSLPHGFGIERIYYVDGLEVGVSRGSHAHLVQSQALFVMKGKILVTLDDGRSSFSVKMAAHGPGLLLPRLIWATIEAEEEGSLYLVMADGPYDRSEYISDYDEFKALKR